MAEAVAAIKEQQSKADAHGGAAKQRGESCFSPNPNPNLNPNLNPSPDANLNPNPNLNPKPDQASHSSAAQRAA